MTNPVLTTDPRVRRTRRFLGEALLSLMEEQDLPSITVQDITKTADVNRATLYLHYKDKDDLACQTLDALFEELTEDQRAFVDAHVPLSPNAPPEPLVSMFSKIRERPRLYLRLLDAAGDMSMSARLVAFFEEQFMRHWPDENVPVRDGDPPPVLRARFVSSTILGTLSWWLRDGLDESPATVTAWLWGLVSPVWFPETGEDAS